MAKKKSKPPAQDFIDAQKNANAPWKYYTKGHPTPFDKAEGSHKGMAIFQLCVGVFLCLMAFAMFCTSFKAGRNGTLTLNWDGGLAFACLLISTLGVLCIRGGKNHWAKHEAQQQARKQKAKQPRRRKKKQR